MYGMLLLLWLNMVLLIVVVSLISVITTYTTIQAQNWEWWWRSFFVGASAGGWMLLYSLYAMIFEFKMDLLAGDLIYILYMSFCSSMFGMSCGLISVFSSYVFLHEIYSKSRSD